MSRSNLAKVVKRCANSNCNKLLQRRGARCDSCRRYLRTHGIERPVELCRKILHRNLYSKCKICRHSEVRGGGRCIGCWSYFNRTGRERPKHLWSDGPCSNCGRPLEQLKKHQKCKGMCHGCYRYKRRTGKSRPLEFCGIGPYSWCECGAVASVGGKCPSCRDR